MSYKYHINPETEPGAKIKCRFNVLDEEQYANETKEAGLGHLEYSKVELVTQNDETFSDSVSWRS